MSEYIEIETEIDEVACLVYINTQLVLASSGDESYPTIEAMEQGTALAQFLSQIEGIQTLALSRHRLIASHRPSIPTYVVASELGDALKDFFL